MDYTFTIVDHQTRAPIEGTISYYRGMDKVAGSTTVGTGGVSVDVPSDITQIQVSSDGYYTYTTQVATLFDSTEFQLDKKPSMLKYILIGGAIALGLRSVYKNH